MGIGSSGVVNCANTYLGTANYTVADGYVADRTVIVDGNGPAQLNLNFARDEVLDPRISFSRTSNATRVNAQGLIEYAPHNLLPNSENFDNAAWVKGVGVTVTPNATASPDGAITADLISSPQDQGCYENLLSIGTGITVTNSIYIKAGTATRLLFRDDLGTGRHIVINPSTGQIVGSSGTILASGSISMGNGWYRYYMTYVTDSVNARNWIRNDTAGTLTYYTWGAQLNIGSLQPYYTTSVKNLLGYSQNFENAAWTKSNSTIDATPVMGPLGFLGAEKLVEDTATNSNHRLRQIIAVNTGTPMTISIYAKAGERNSFDLFDAYTSKGAYFNLANGTVTTPQSSGLTFASNATINNLGYGWYICSVTTTTNTTSISLSLLISNGSTTTYTGDGTSGVYIFGAQLSDSASLDPYVYNFGAAPTSSAYYGPRFDYDPVTLAPKGLLIEEQRINILLNSDTLSTQSVSVTAQAYTLSFYGTGSVALSGAYTGSLVGTGVYPNRVQLTFTPAIGTLTLTVTGSVRYANLEAGSFPTSYIPTTSAQVTRAADNASMVGTNFSSWYNQSEGTVYSEWILGNDVISRQVYNINDGTLSNYIRNRYSSTGTAGDNAVVVSGVAQAILESTNQITTNSTYKNAMAYKQDDFARSSSGILVTDTLGSIPTVTQINIGSSAAGTGQLNGHIQSFKFFSKRFINTYLQSLTQ